jgi:hypothetical protein
MKKLVLAIVLLSLPGLSAFSKPYVYGVPSALNENSFNEIFDLVEKAYSSDVANRDAKLVTNRFWFGGGGTLTGGAGAATRKSEMGEARWIVSVPGTLAGLPYMTEDSFLLVVCHELGHHLGGTPKFVNIGYPWMSSEGQADYFASRCFKRIRSSEPNSEFIKTVQISSSMVEKCERAFSNLPDQALCIRTLKAAEDLMGALFHYYVEIEKQSVTQPLVVAQDNSVFNAATLSGAQVQHAKISQQCRLDTFVAGAVCSKDPSANGESGNCTGGPGTRPTCWFGN